MGYMNNQRRNKVFLILLVLVLILSQAALFARAGGAGGSSGSSGSSDSDGGAIFYLIYMIFRMLPFPFNFIFLILIVFAGWRYSKKKSNDSKAFNHLPSAPAEGKKVEFKGAQWEGFNRNEFIKKVEQAFMAIQKGWSEQHLSGVRRYLSDGLYQRFRTQFQMMKILKQENRLENLQIRDIWIEKAESDGEYQQLHCGIHASVRDRFIFPDFPSLNSGGQEEFTEFWTFIRKKEAKGDLYSSVKCPGCGAPLQEDNLDVVTCPYCGNLLNNGSYDWILSEITQSEDWAASNKGLRKKEQVASKIQAQLEGEDFSVQLLEDKASNAWFHIKSALTQGKPGEMARFMTDELYKKLNASEKEEAIAYSRLYLNHATLIAADYRGEKAQLYVLIKSSYQRVRLREGKNPILLDPYMSSHQEVLLMERDRNPGVSRGSLYADRCPSCGEPVKEAEAIRCPSCDELYNNGKKDWVISAVLSMAEYHEASKNADVQMSVDALDGLYHVRDYAMNNLMLMIAVDGSFAQEEIELAKQFCKKLGYSAQQLQSLFSQASLGRLVIRMPEDMVSRKKIYRLMEKAAHSDQHLSPEEQNLLDHIEQQYLMNG